MERLEAMKTAAAGEMERLLENRLQEMFRFCEANRDTAARELNEKLDSLDIRDGGQLVFSYLRSSCVTGSHRIKLACYTGAPFVELHPSKTYYSLAPFLEGTDADLERLAGVLCGQFIHVFDWYLEEIRRLYFGRIYEECGKLFSLLLEDGKVGITGRAEAVEAWFGAEMGQLRPVGKIGPRGRDAVTGEGAGAWNTLFWRPTGTIRRHP